GAGVCAGHAQPLRGRDEAGRRGRAQGRPAGETQASAGRDGRQGPAERPASQGLTLLTTYVSTNLLCFQKRTRVPETRVQESTNEGEWRRQTKQACVGRVQTSKVPL